MKYKFKIIIFILFFLLFSTRPKDSNTTPYDIGGRILISFNPAICADPYTCKICALCGCGAWFEVEVMPYGGTNINMCPFTPAMKGSNPMFMPGGYVLAGGMGAKMMDPMNTASVLGKIENSIFYALSKLFYYLS